MVDVNTTTRREFIATTLGLLTTAAMGRLSAAEPDERVRVAVIGTGGRGCSHVRALSTVSDANIVAVCDDYEPHLKDGAQYAGPQAQTFADYRAMLEKAKPQAVVIATPLNWHYQMCVDALEAGCDVFCEKTMTHNIDESRKLIAKVTASKRVFQVGFQRHANPIYLQAKAMVDAGTIGRITAIKAQWHRNNNWRRPVPVPRTDAKWETLEKRLNWRLFRASSQGLMSELGGHQLDVANWMLGTTPTRVIAAGGIDYWRDGREVADNVFCIYEYAVKVPESDRETVAKDPYTVRVTYSSLCNNAFEGASEIIMGTRGTLFLTEAKGMLWLEKLDDAAGEVRTAGAQKDSAVITSGKTLSLKNDPWAFRGKPTEIDAETDSTREELASFIAHVKLRDPETICDVNAGARATATTLIANEAMDTGKPVEYPHDLRG